MEATILHPGPLTERFNPRLARERNVVPLWQPGDALAGNFLLAHHERADYL